METETRPGTADHDGPSFQRDYKWEVFDELRVCRRLQKVSPESFYIGVKNFKRVVKGLLASNRKHLEQFVAECDQPVPALQPNDPELPQVDPEQSYTEVLDEDAIGEWLERMLVFLGARNYLTYLDRSSTMF